MLGQVMLHPDTYTADQQECVDRLRSYAVLMTSEEDTSVIIDKWESLKHTLGDVYLESTLAEH